jgi:type I restriction-modification system DNA methylase subunit
MKHVLQPFPKHLQTLHQVDSEATIEQLWKVRRKKGQFYTPTNLAKHGWAYLVKELGKDFWVDGTWRIWDCCCGEGGLAINVSPQSALQYTYLSSLDPGEVDFVRQHLPRCKKVWRMDFLNTQLHDFPEEIRREIAGQSCGNRSAAGRERKFGKSRRPVACIGFC